MLFTSYYFLQVTSDNITYVVFIGHLVNENAALFILFSKKREKMSASATKGSFQTPASQWQPAPNMLQTQFPSPARKDSKALRDRLLKAFTEEVDSGTSTLNDLFLDRLRELLLTTAYQSAPQLRLSKSTYTMHFKERGKTKKSLPERVVFDEFSKKFLGIIGSTVLSTQSRSPWKKCLLPTADTVELTSRMQTHMSSFSQFFTKTVKPPYTSHLNDFIVLANLISEVVQKDPQALVLPLRPDVYNFDVGIKILHSRVQRVLGHTLKRYIPPEGMTKTVLKAEETLKEKIWPVLKKCDAILGQENVDMIALHHALLELNGFLWYKGETILMNAFFQQSELPNKSEIITSAPAFCCALVDAPLHAIRDEGLIHTICYFLEKNALSNDDIELVVSLVFNCFKILADEDDEFSKRHNLSHAGSDPQNKDFVKRLENFLQINSLFTSSFGFLSKALEGRLESLKEGESSSKLWAILLRDAWVCTAVFDNCRLLLTQILSSIDEKELSENGLALSNALTHKIHLILATIAIAETHLQKLLDQCKDAIMEQERSLIAEAESVAQKLIATEGERKKAPRRIRSFLPLTEREPIAPEKPPHFVKETENVDSAKLHDTLRFFKISLNDPDFDSAYRMGYACSMQQNLLHFFKQLNERELLKGEERLYGDIDLLRRVIEGTLELAAAHFPISDDKANSLLQTETFRTHELQKLIIPLLDSEQVAENIKGIITAHQEVILTLSFANLCVHYPTSTAKKAIANTLSHKRIRWLLNYLSAEFDGEQHRTLINQTLHFVSEILKGLKDPSYGPGKVEIILKEEFAEDEDLPNYLLDTIVEEMCYRAPLKEVGILSPRGALYGISSIQSWIEIRQMSSSCDDEMCNVLRDEAFQHAALYLRRLSSRLSDTRRLLRSSDSCWGEVDLVQRLIKELLIASLFHNGHKNIALRYRYENNPLVLADLLTEKNIKLSSLPSWLAQVHPTSSFPVHFDGSKRKGPLADALNRADELSVDLDRRKIMESVDEFEKQFIFPALQAAWNIVEQGFHA